MLRSFKRSSPAEVFLSWADGHEGPIHLTTLREGCPCAECAGETVLLREYVPRPPDKETPGRYELKSAETVGNYALKFLWGDGHAEGLYTWEHLRSLCECDECRDRRSRKATPGVR